MWLKDLHLKFKAFRLKRFLVRGGASKKRKPGVLKKQSWMTPISHGYHVVEDQSSRGGLDARYCDSVVVQREEVDETELWFFGIYDSQVGDSVTKFMQSHFFDRNIKRSQMRRKSKETMTKAYLGARAKAREAEKKDETWGVGSASVMVIDGEKLVIATLGDYRAVICKDGAAHQLSSRLRHTANSHWSRRFFPARILACHSGKITGTKHSKGTGLAVGTEKIDSETEFVIVASTGIWDVMRNQEAVGLIGHIEDAQEAAECLAKEALTRMSRGNISCLVIRFD